MVNLVTGKIFFPLVGPDGCLVEDASAMAKSLREDLLNYRVEHKKIVGVSISPLDSVEKNMLTRLPIGESFMSLSSLFDRIILSPEEGDKIAFVTGTDETKADIVVDGKGRRPLSTGTLVRVEGINPRTYTSLSGILSTPREVGVRIDKEDREESSAYDSDSGLQSMVEFDDSYLYLKLLRKEKSALLGSEESNAINRYYPIRTMYDLTDIISIPLKLKEKNGIEVLLKEEVNVKVLGDILKYHVRKYYEGYEIL